MFYSAPSLHAPTSPLPLPAGSFQDTKFHLYLHATEPNYGNTHQSPIQLSSFPHTPVPLFFNIFITLGGTYFLYGTLLGVRFEIRKRFQRFGFASLSAVKGQAAPSPRGPRISWPTSLDTFVHSNPYKPGASLRGVVPFVRSLVILSFVDTIGL